MALQRSKVTNLRLAAARLDGLTLKPGETLSFWRAVGKPTRRRGYVEGMILRNGRVASGVGGGLCQMTNLLYWMTLHTPSPSPSGGGTATTCFPTPTAPSPLAAGPPASTTTWISWCATTPPRHLAAGAPGDGHPSGGGEWRADGPQTCRYEVYEKEHEIRGEYWGGFTRHNTLFRRVLGMDGAELGKNSSRRTTPS